MTGDAKRAEEEEGELIQKSCNQGGERRPLLGGGWIQGFLHMLELGFNLALLVECQKDNQIVYCCVPPTKEVFLSSLVPPPPLPQLLR